jgi:thiamine biosynthesis lipoprotein
MMGTFVTVTVLDGSKDKSIQAVDSAFNTMRNLTPVMDRHQASTPIGELNSSGKLKDIPPELAAVLFQAKYFHTISQGAFDPSILPVLELTEQSFTQSNQPPAGSEFSQAMDKVGLDQLQIGPEGVSFARSGMRLTLDGIAKGYIIDQAINTLQGMGIKYALINAGGDIRTLSGKGPDSAWQVGVKDPRGQRPLVQTLALNNGALATSGNYEHYYDSQKDYHHLIETKSGYSPQDITSVSVLAPTTAEADALSTTLFVKPRPQAVALAQSLPHVQALILGPDLRDSSTSNWPGSWA